jgi:Icc-related predicted phosphoesterase
VTLTIFFATDVHGSDRCFRKFINAGAFYGADVLIMGGDLTGKVVVPVVAGPDGTYRAELNGRRREVDRRGLEELLAEIRFNGQYPFVTTADELAAVQREPDGVKRLFRQAIEESMAGWLRLAEERLRPQGRRIFLSPGNDDEPFVGELIAHSGYAENPDERIVDLAPGVSMLSLGYSNPTPWKSPRELPEEELARRLAGLARQMPTSGVRIYNIHVPPLDSSLDQAAALDETLKPVVEGGAVKLVGVGSRAVRERILADQPDLGLHGHIHESAGIVRLGRTVCINPGSEYSDGVLRGALVVVDPRKRKLSYQLTMG